MDNENGGPAFPCQARTPEQVEYDIWPEQGMSLRDYFAGQALAFMGNAHVVEAILNAAKARTRSSLGVAASYAYELADAMLAARKGES